MASYLNYVLLHLYCVFLEYVYLKKKKTTLLFLLPPSPTHIPPAAPAPVLFSGLWSIWFNRLPVAAALTAHRRGALCCDAFWGQRV